MSGKHVVVTGPSLGGIGFHTACDLLRRGAKVTLAARSKERGQQAADAMAAKVLAAGEAPHVMLCDVASLDSVRNFASELQAGPLGEVDVLVDNAGVYLHEEGVSPDGVELTFATCALGHHLLNHLLKPRRVVWVTGDIYCMSKPPVQVNVPGVGTNVYANACLARLLLARELQRRATSDGTGVPEVVAVHPGVIPTELMQMGPVSRGIFSKLMISLEQGAQASVYAATCPSADLPRDTIYYHNKRGWVILPPSDLAMDDVAAKDIFAKCDELCKIQR